ncbi:unnamed protein product [Caenorhabditis brenneri]
MKNFENLQCQIFERHDAKLYHPKIRNKSAIGSRRRCRFFCFFRNNGQLDYVSNNALERGTAATSSTIETSTTNVLKVTLIISTMLICVALYLSIVTYKLMLRYRSSQQVYVIYDSPAPTGKLVSKSLPNSGQNIEDKPVNIDV